MSAVGRADLLRALAQAPRNPQAVALDIDDSGWFGYVRREAPNRVARRFEPAGVAGEAPESAPTGFRLPLRMPFAWVVVSREPPATMPVEVEEPEFLRTGPLQPDQVNPLSCRCQVGYEDLVPRARLLPALRRHLGATRAGSLDMERIMTGLAAGRVPRRLPHRQQRRWHPELVVVLDFSRRLWPYGEDMHRLAARLHRLCGGSGISLRVFEYGPAGPWSDWVAHQQRHRNDIPPDRPWTMPLPGAPVLVVGDLGRLLGAGSPLAQAWSGFVERLKRAQLTPIALAPLGAEQLDGALTQALPVIRWSPDATAHPARGHGAANAEPKGLDEMLAMVAATRRVDPPLLRAMRQVTPTAPLNAGLEGAVWCHPDVEADFAATIRTDRQRDHLQRFRDELPGLHTELAQMRRKHHCHLPIALTHEETLLWWAYAKPDARRRAEEQLTEAVTFVDQLADTLAAEREAPVAEGDWAAVAQGIWRRAEGTDLPRTFRVLHRLGAQLPAARGAPGEPAPCWLVQDSESGQLRLQGEPPGPRQIGLAEPLTVDAGGLDVRIDGQIRRLSLRHLPADLTPLCRPATLRLESAGEVLTVAAAQRPRGAAGWECRRDGISVNSPIFCGEVWRWGPDRLGFYQQSGSDRFAIRAQALGSTPTRTVIDRDALQNGEYEIHVGLDEDFGVAADLHVGTKHGKALQRFRFIEPGTFLMGSPESEDERIGDEGPQHCVTISRGFWLADTACTQALWQAVMGKNPSHFKGADRPVENVSWHDVQAFLRQLEELLPACGADLPTEAEWEYACRAGTTTPFSFGDTITTDQVNYDGNHPYAGGEKGRDREETVAVTSLPPNPWGLYEMHGNVWEWCADGLRDYDAAPQQDPRGPEGKDALRVDRGGSWFIEAWYARSAYRRAIHPGIAILYQGFRFCLRSIKPG